MTRNNTKKIIQTCLTALISLGTVVYFLVICVQGLKQEFIENGWKATKGTILSPGLILDGHQNIKRKQLGIEQIINYEYDVDGVKFQSNSVSRDITVNINDYPEGKTVEVYYNPNQVYESVLVRTPVQKLTLYSMIVSSIAVIGIILYFSVRNLKALSKR